MPYHKNRSTTRKLKRGGQRPTQRPTRKELIRVAYNPIRPTRINNMTATFTKPTATTQDGQNFSISFPFFKPKGAIKGGKTRKIRRKSQRKRQH